MGPIATTAQGRVEGRTLDSGVKEFLGIPFAAPPLGPLRFRPPARPEPWDGVRPALKYGLPALQWTSEIEGVFGAMTRCSEDCLYLNVWTPEVDDAKRPVMVWIPGGGFYAGAASSPSHSGDSFAIDGVVMVSFNYRLGVVGWLDLEGEFAGAGTTPGLKDQVQALEWVRENIESFGGDPDNVTIFGCSAGGMAVTTLLAMPSARGLVRRAISQSGAGHHYLSQDRARSLAHRFRELTGVAAQDWDALTDVPSNELLRVQGVLFSEVMERTMDVPGSGVTCLPVVDGDLLPGPPTESLGRGPGLDADLLVGSNKDEWTLFNYFNLESGLAAEGLESELDRVLGAQGRSGAQFLKTYATNRVDPSERDLVVAVETDRWYRIPAIRLAEAHSSASSLDSSTFMYRFSWPTPAYNGHLRACHGLEIVFVFDTFTGPEVPALTGENPPRDLSAAMHAAWVAFAMTGDPQHPGLPAWPQYEVGTRSTMEFDVRSRVVNDPDDAERQLWDGIL